MNLDGMISGPPHRSSGRESSPHTPGSPDRTDNFGDVIISKLRGPKEQTSEGEVGPEIMPNSGANPRQLQPKIVEEFELMDPNLNAGQSLGVQPRFAAEENAEEALNSEFSDLAHNLQPDVGTDSKSIGSAVAIIREAEASVGITAIISAHDQPNADPRTTKDLAGNSSSLSASATTIVPTNSVAQSTVSVPADPATPPIPAARINTVASVSTVAQALSDVVTGISADIPVNMHVAPPNSKSLNTTGSARVLAGSENPVQYIPPPSTRILTGEPSTLQVRKALAAIDVAPPSEPASKPAPSAAPGFPELPTMAEHARDSIIHHAVLQAHGESGQGGLAAASAATIQPSIGTMPGMASIMLANAGGSEIAGAIAPQISMAIGLNTRSDRIELRLDPPELGNVEIFLEINDKSLRATLAADRPATNELLRRYGEVLVAQLKQAGFTEINLQFAANQGGAHRGNTPRAEYSSERGALANGADDREGTDAPYSAAARRTTDGLDLRF